MKFVYFLINQNLLYLIVMNDCCRLIVYVFPIWLFSFGSPGAVYFVALYYNYAIFASQSIEFRPPRLAFKVVILIVSGARSYVDTNDPQSKIAAKIVD